MCDNMTVLRPGVPQDNTIWYNPNSKSSRLDKTKQQLIYLKAETGDKTYFASFTVGVDKYAQLQVPNSMIFDFGVVINEKGFNLYQASGGLKITMLYYDNDAGIMKTWSSAAANFTGSSKGPTTSQMIVLNRTLLIQTYKGIACIPIPIHSMNT